MMGNHTTLEREVAYVLEELQRTGYRPSTIHQFERVYSRLFKLAAVMQSETLSPALVDRFINDSAHTRTGQYCHSRKRLHQLCVRMLRECEDTGCLSGQPGSEIPVATPTTAGFQEWQTQFLNHLRAEQKSSNTVNSYRNISCKFLVFLESRGYTALQEVPLESPVEFFRELRRSWDAGSLRIAASGLRSFLHFADAGSRLLSGVPVHWLRKRTILPVLTPDEEHALWAVLQTDAVSSRDQAIMTLVLLTGLRAVDLLALKLRDIHWQTDVIHIIQTKTKQPLILPLLPAMGNALARYIVHDRPASDSPCVFLSDHAPYHPLQHHASCYAIVSKVFSCAGVRAGKELKGTRLLRHHVASKMLRNGVALSTISATLGHVNPETTDIYLTADEEKLRDCAATLTLIPMKVEALR